MQRVGTDNILGTAEKNELKYPMQSDSSLAVANAFGIALELAPELVELYSKVGNDLPTLYGNRQSAIGSANSRHVCFQCRGGCWLIAVLNSTTAYGQNCPKCWRCY